MTIRITRTIALVASAAIAAPAAAETLTVEGIYGASADLPADIEVIAIERFAGNWGFELRDEVSRILSEPIEGGEPFFRVVPEVLAGGDDNRPDAAMQGAAHASVSDHRTSPRIKKECVRRDDKDKCVERREIRIPCRELSVEYEARLSLIARDGTRLHETGDVLEESRTYCRDDHVEPDAESMIATLASRYAASLVGTFAPRRLASTPRLLEQRKGLSGSDRRAFKQALKLTENDPYGACLAFAALEDANPGHVSVLLNIGLCHESEDRLDEAESYYHRALDADPGKHYPLDGLQRIALRRLGEAQLAARDRSREGS